jgi:transposase-like protein
MIKCKRCFGEIIVKNGKVRDNVQRYKCKDCRCNFVEGDNRVKPELVAKKALAIILYSLGKSSFGMLGKIFGNSRSLTYRWVRQEAEKLPDPVVSNDVCEVEFDEMWHFLQKKVKNSGSSKRWIVAHGELLRGLQVVVMLKPSSDFMKK